MSTISGTEDDAVNMHGIVYSWRGSGAFSLQIPQFAVNRGERVLLLGPSGSGKSTLLSLMAGVVAPKQGAVKVLDTTLSTLTSAARDRFRAEHFGIVFQMFNLLPYGNAIDNVVLPLAFAPERKRRAIEAGGERQEARRLLAALGLAEDLHGQSAATLSVGEQQRVAVARALIGSPEIIVADEPTSALDDDRQKDFLDLLFAQVDQVGATLVMVTHDRRLADRFGRMIRLGDIILRDAKELA